MTARAAADMTRTPCRAMSAEALVEILDDLKGAGVHAWLEGGWGVDALLGEQTREHDDLDLVIDRGSVDAAIAALGERGFAMWKDERPTAFVLRDPRDRRVDFHPVDMIPEGGIQVQPDGSGFLYPADGLRGVGQVGGRTVRCLTAELQVRCHAGYELDATDLHDMFLLRDRLGVPLPY